MTMERTDILDLMGELKLYGMRAAYDEVMATGDQAPARTAAHRRRSAEGRDIARSRRARSSTR